MIVFGDLVTSQEARPALASIFARFRATMRDPSGAGRHARLVDAYIEAASVAQGCVDAEFAASGTDSLTPLHTASLAGLGAMARVVAASWTSEFNETDALDQAPLDEWLARAPAHPVEARVAEGFAFYALYPEACLGDVNAGAREGAVVIGVRSIGMALAPLLAQARGASLCVTLRPHGHPFARVCSLAPDVRAALRARRNARFLVIDEGPGLSGSSFISVADALEGAGVARERIAFVASNPGGPGAAASPECRERWVSTQRHILDCAPAIHRALAPRVIARDLGGGRWRDGHANAAAPANRAYERRKMLIDDDGRWIAKFTGLGPIGAVKARWSRALAQAGFTPATGEWRQGFLLHRWIENARSIEFAPRAGLIAHMADYIAFRARNLEASPTGGASLETLFAMARANCAQGLGEDAAGSLDRYAPALDVLARIERPIASDNRMQAWEWICDESGAILKCDAADHCASHDLVGCRDAAWDAAGAIIEFSLARDERKLLLQRIEAHAVEIAPPLLDFFLVACCAFHLGAATMAAEASAAWPDDARRWRAEARRYAAALREFIVSPARFQ